MTDQPAFPPTQFLLCPHCNGQTDYVGPVPTGASVQCSHCRKFFQLKSSYSTTAKVLAAVGAAVVALMLVGIGVSALFVIRWTKVAQPIAGERSPAAKTVTAPALPPTVIPVESSTSTPPILAAVPTPATVQPNPALPPVVADSPSPAVVAPPADLPPVVPPADAVTLQYKWKENEKYEYRYSVEATVLDRKTTFSGFSSFTAQRPTITATPQTVQSSGTGFVISADGHLLTCHHVVDGATKIEVILGGKTYTGKVLSSDRTIDVALVKIDATGLLPLAMADNSGMELGQELTSIGFPLSDVLGESIKVNRGSMAGLVRQSGRNLIQVDASINPGNSGGPVLDNRGRVVGMASEKLYGSRVTNVGLCVPADELRRWLTGKAAQASLGGNTPVLSGTDLAKLAVPSVALVKVSSTGSSSGSWELQSSSMMFEHVDSSPFSIGIPNTTIDQGKLLVNENGEVIEDTEASSLPMMLGPIAAITLDSLPTDGSREWKVERPINIFRQNDQQENSLTPRLRRRTLSPFDSPSGKRKIEVSTATETIEYKITELDEKTATIEKRMKLATDPGTKVGMELSFQGKVIFDRERGVMKSGSLEGSYTLTNDKITIRVPLKISYEPHSSGKVASAAASEKKKEQPDPKVQQELDKLSSDKANRTEILAALQSLTEMKRDKPSREAVVSEVAKLLESSDSEVRVAALKTLANWDWSTLSKDIVKLLDHTDSPTRTAAIAYLGAMQDGEAATALCERLSHAEDRAQAASALKEIGAAAEDAVIAKLKQKNADVRIVACDILAEIGGQESVVLLKMLAKQNSPAGEASKAALKKMGYEFTPPSKAAPKAADDGENPFGSSKKQAAPPTDDNENPFKASPKPAASKESSSEVK